MKRILLIGTLLIIVMLSGCSTFENYHINVTSENLLDKGIISEDIDFIMYETRWGNIDTIKLTTTPDIQLVDETFDILENSYIEVNFFVNGYLICSEPFEFYYYEGLLTNTDTDKYASQVCNNFDIKRKFSESEIIIVMEITYNDSQNQIQKEELEIFKTDDLLMYFIEDFYARDSQEYNELGEFLYEFNIATRDGYITKVEIISAVIYFDYIEDLTEDSIITFSFSVNGYDVCQSSIEVAYVEYDYNDTEVFLPSCVLRFTTEEALTMDEFGFDSIEIIMTYSYNDITTNIVFESITDMEYNKVKIK